MVCNLWMVIERVSTRGTPKPGRSRLPQLGARGATAPLPGGRGVTVSGVGQTADVGRGMRAARGSMSAVVLGLFALLAPAAPAGAEPGPRPDQAAAAAAHCEAA